MNLPKCLLEEPSIRIGDLYLGYYQFQLAVGSRDIKYIMFPIVLRMWTLPQGATNSIAHRMKGVQKVLKNFISHITMPFLDYIPIKGCEEIVKDKELDKTGFWKFVSDHRNNCEKLLTRLDEVHLTLPGTKSVFGAQEVLVVRRVQSKPSSHSLLVGEQSNTWRILFHNDRKSRHRRIKKQSRMQFKI